MRRNGSFLLGEAFMPTCLLEAPAIRMATKDARTETYRILATFRVFHQAIREIDR
jgi:hypothetical protein